MLLDGRSLRIQKGRTDARYVGAGNWLRAVAAEDYNAAEANSNKPVVGGRRLGSWSFSSFIGTPAAFIGH